MGYSSYKILLNIGNILIGYLIYILLLVLMIIAKLLRCLNKVFEFLKKTLIFDFVLKIIMESYIICMVAVFISFK